MTERGILFSAPKTGPCGKDIEVRLPTPGQMLQGFPKHGGLVVIDIESDAIRCARCNADLQIGDYVPRGRS